MLHAHVIAAAKVLLSQGNFDKINDLAVTIVETHVSLLRFDSTALEACQDKVQLYASEVGIIVVWLPRCHPRRRWRENMKFLLVLFKSTNHPNYAKEAVNLLIQYYYNLSERQKAQLLWSYCIMVFYISSINLFC